MDRAASLRVLSIAFYIYAGITVLAGIAMLAVLEVLLRPNFLGTGKDAQEVARMFGAFRPLFGFAFALIATKAILCAVAGRAIARRRRWTLCIVAGSVALLDLPMGTVLGIFTLTLLYDPATRAEFESGREAVTGTLAG